MCNIFISLTTLINIKDETNMYSKIIVLSISQIKN